MVAHRAGRLDEAAAGYQAVLRSDPDEVEALQLLGLIRHRQARTEEALTLLDRAVVLDPEHAIAWANRGLVLRALGRPEQANESLRRALALRPELKEAWQNLARGLAALGHMEDAIDAARRGAVESPAGTRLLAGLLFEAQRWADVVPVIGQCLSQGLREPGLLVMLAHAQQERGDHAGAGRTWQVAARAPGADADALAGLGGWLSREGRAEEAVPWLVRALEAAPERHSLALALTDALSQCPPGAVDEATLLTLLGRTGLDHQRLERHLTGALERLPGVGALLEAASAPLAPEVVEAAARPLLAHPLLQLGLRRALLRPPAWERALSALAAAALDALDRGSPLPRDGVEALALHAWNSEYTSGTSPERSVRARRLDAQLSEIPLPDWSEREWHALATLATNQPLVESPWTQALAGPGWQDRPLADLVRQQLIEPAAERALLPQIPELARTSDAVSGAVRQMYEENPYPRLVSVHRRSPTPLGALLRAWLRRPDLEVPAADPLQVLVAGCGTGQHALNSATRTANAEVLAVDLSRPSLARAARLAAAYEVKNLRFACADILGLDALPAAFHVVESVGVLHHLDDPAAGLRVLRDRLLPGGLMQLGLYSERGRQDVLAGRALIAEAGWQPTPEGIRAARAAIQALPPDHPAAPLVRSPDFASLSGTRDLLFHVCERRYTPLGLRALLDGAGLELLGFQHSQPSVGALYRERFPEDPTATDLSRWEKLEDEHPRIFSGMFVFWCRRR